MTLERRLADIAACTTSREIGSLMKRRRHASGDQYPTEKEKWAWRARRAEIRLAERQAKKDETK